ncbi:MAG: CSLREA domain-containing protein [Bryobacteraceae bacterium]|jgi:CSLREA domain-containing protein/fimbrial isopeptide formation D2 family protein/uncharacterized repeat protein (TIGR01451 family)
MRKLAPLLILIPLGAWLTICHPVQIFAQDEQAKLYLARETRVDTHYRAGLSRLAAPLSLASEDFDGDGIQDLAVGLAIPAGGTIAIHRGNLDAFAPQSEASFLAIGRGEFPSPYLPDAQLVQIPGRPDFLVAGDFFGLDGPGMVAATRGGSALYVLARGASGSTELLQSIDVGGAITALGAHRLQNGKYADLLVGAHNNNGSRLFIYRGSPAGLSQVAAFPLSADATSFAFGDLDGDGLPDVLILAGGKVSILHGGSRTIDSVEVPYQVAAADVGRFVFDRDPLPQIALLATDGTLQMLAHGVPDQRPYTADEILARRQANLRNPRVPQAQRTVVWQEIESYPQVGAPDSAGRAPLMFRTRISSNGADDVLLLNAARMSVVAHSDRNPASGIVIGRADLGVDAVAALPARVNIDGRPGVVFLARGDTVPHAMMPLPDPTFTVNTAADTVDANPGDGVCADATGHCSLRAAIMEANALPGTDTIMIPAGTYTLTIARSGNPVYDARTGTLDVTDSVNIIGNGQATTIIQGGTVGVNPGPANGVDKVFSFNQDIASMTDATVSISNLTIQNGYNRGNTSLYDGWGGAFDFDTGESGNSSLTLTNVTLNNNTLTDGEGGGFAVFNTNGGAGTATFNSCIVENNVAAPSSTGDVGNGGGAYVATSTPAPATVVMTSSQVINNQAKANAGFNPNGGAFEVLGNLTLHGTTVSGNTTAGVGGGIEYTDGNSLTLDQGTIISGNTSTGEGGGIWFTSNSGKAGNLSKVSITGNSAKDGGGIYILSGNLAPFTMQYSRIEGNSATGGAGTGGNFSQPTPVQPTPGTINITDNWWGTNAPLGTFELGSGNTTTYDPFIVLTHTANPQKIHINQSTTLTANMSLDDHGSGAALSGNLNEIIGLPVTFDNPTLGTIPQAQPEILNAGAQATATFNAGNTAGFGSAHATVDQAVVAANSNLIASATETGTTATITTVGAHGFSAGEYLKISGVGVSGYDTSAGQFVAVASTPTVTTFTYTAGASGLAASSGGLANAGILILQPPSIAKSFYPTTVATTGAGGTTASAITFSITNGNVVPIDASFADNLPTNVGTSPGSLVVASTPSVVNNCGGSVTATAGAGSISFSNTTLPVGTCTIQVNVQSSVDNTYSNGVTIDSTDAGNGNTSSATLTVIAPPGILKAFAPTTIPYGATSLLTFTISSANVNLTLDGVAFTDNLPSGLIVATPNNLNSTCSGTATATAGSSSASLSGATLAPGASCTVSLNVQGSTVGLKNNSVVVTSSNAGAGNTSTASITVASPPSISKSFGASSIALGATTSLSFTLSNPNGTTTLSGIGFTDTLPSGLKIASPSNGLTGSCGGGTITATPGSGSISLSGATLASVGSCTFSVNVTGTAAGTQNNVTSAVTSNEGGTGNTASASINVEAPPQISKSFGAATIGLNASTNLTFTITNPAGNPASLTGVGFTDTLPTGLTVTSATTATCGGTLTVTAPVTISLAGATVATGTPCTFSVTVTGATAGSYTNTTGNVTSSDGGTGSTASANLTVASPPSISKGFSPNSIPVGGTSTLTFNVTNPNSSLALSGVAFTDTLPSGMVVASTPGATNTCGGAVTANGGASSVSLASGSIPASGSCAVSVSVQGIITGTLNNSVQVTSSNAGTGNTSNASLVVEGPPSISKSFGAATIGLNASTNLTFTITNPAGNPATLTGVGFTDTLPTGLTVTTATSAVCGGTLTVTAPGAIQLANATVVTGTPCQFSVSVTGATAGSYTNTTGNVTSSNGGTGNTANASLTVEAPPSISKSFGASAIGLNASTNLSFTITNPAGNPTILTGVGFTDTLPTGLTVTSATSSICGGTLTVTAPVSIALSGATVATGTPCTFNVSVTGAASGSYTNTTGSVTSTNGGTGNTASASVTVGSAPGITKAFGASTIPLNGTTTLTFAITNPNPSFSLTGVAFTDSMPSGLTVGSTPNLNNTCGGTATATAGATSASLSGGTIAGGGSCTVSLNVQGTPAGVKNNSVQVTSTNAGTGNTSTASITVVSPPSLSKAFGASSTALNGSTLLTFSIQNNNATQSLSGIGFTDTLPAGLLVATPNGLSGSCAGGTITAAAGTGAISLSGATLAASGSCSFSVSVTGIAGGQQNNTTSPVTSNEGGTGNAASASVTVVAPPSIAKAFGIGSIALSGSTTLTFTIVSPAANTVTETGVAFSDSFPAGLVVSSSPGLTNTCGGTAAATAGATSVSLTGGTIAVNSQCQVSVSVTGTTAGIKNNTTSNVTSTNGGTGNTASASVTVGPAPTTVTILSSTVANGTYGIGAVIPITVTFSGAVNVTGTPQLALNSGGIANYTSGSGTTTLTFTYVVAAGQNSAHLDASSSSALTLNGGTITDLSATSAVLTLPIGATSGSLFANKNIAIDTVSPTVVSYSVLWGTESYNVIGTVRNRLPWQITGIQVVFSKPITTGNVNSLTGIPVTAFAGLGTNTLTWTISPESLGSFATQLAGSGANALKDASGNSLAGGVGFSQNLKILWGDFSDDGYVNATDILQVNSAISQAYNIFADMNGDGVVSIADVQVVRSRAGTTLP